MPSSIMEHIGGECYVQAQPQPRWAKQDAQKASGGAK